MNYRMYYFGLLVLQGAFCIGMQNDGFTEVKKKGPKKPIANLSNMLTHACAANKSTLVNQLLVQVNVNARNSEGSCPLGVAACCNRLSIANDLLDHEAYVDQTNYKGETPLMGAAYKGRPEMIELLLARGAQIEACDNEGSTALMHAASGGYPAAVQKLVDSHANVNVKNSAKGRTALHWAVRMCEGCVEKNAKAHSVKDVLAIVNILLRAGAQANVKDNEHHTPLNWADEYKIVPLAQLFRNFEARSKS